MGAEQDKREVTQKMYFGEELSSLWLDFMSAELERINTGHHFQNGLISKLGTKLLPDDAFFMAASKRFCPIVATTAVCRFLSAQYAILGTGTFGQIASFELRLRGAAPTPLALPYPFRTST